eukprot:1191610-Amphidinium_carterae.1
MPGTLVPDDEFIEGFERHISNLEVLTERGISSETIAATLRWIADQQSIAVPNSTTPSAMGSLVELIFNKIYPLKAGSKSNRSEKNDIKRRCVSVYDTGSMEASSTAVILKTCLLLPLSHDAHLIPEPSSTGELDKGVSTIIVLCTNGMFEKRRSLDNLSKVNLLRHPGEQPPRLLPLVCEDSFHFPPKDMQLQLEAVGLKGDKVELINNFVFALFKEITIEFDAQHMGESQLQLAAKNVAMRLLTKPTTLVNGISTVYLFASSPEKISTI